MDETATRRELARLRRQAWDGARAALIGHSPAMERLWDLIERVAPTRATVLITGETGVGKELVARAIHALSPRAGKPFIATNCSSLPETLLESELFGHVKGSFTGAIASRKGLFEEAHGGTLFLDEISTISPAIQVKLLRVVQERLIQRVGGGAPVPIDFRLLAASNVDPAGEVAEGRFREDLFYRLSVFPLRVPPLRERRGEIPELARHFLLRAARENQVAPPDLSPEALRRMVDYDWPGNVRELENFVERGVITHGGGGALHFDPPATVSMHAPHRVLSRARDEQWSLARVEREHILQVVEDASGHRGKAAALLGIDRRTLYRKLKEYEHDAAAAPRGAEAATEEDAVPAER